VKGNKSKEIERKVPVIYVGDTIKNVLMKYSIYTNGIPYDNVEIKNMIEQCPKLEKLFIPVHELNKWEQKVKQHGSLEQVQVQTVKEFFEK